VIKIVDPEIRELLGSTNHHPRRAIAYKFPAQQVATQITSIDRQIGRTGILTPVANLTPTKLSGVTISRVSLHNWDFITTKDIRIGDRVRLQRSGEVIPYIVSVITQRRDGNEKEINPDEIRCPAC
jgi:DNA ligase (NAD+)